MQLYLPDARHGFYRGTRFDWSGVVAGMQFRGHHYYEPWFTKCDNTVYDYIDNATDIIAGRQSAITGPAEEFPQPQGFDTAKPGETFVKLGVGVLRKTSAAPYSCYESYEIVDPGTWLIRSTASSIEYTQEVNDARTGCGYVYRKVVSAPSGRSDLVIEHSLHNTGRVQISTEQYNHNFLTLDGTSIGPDFVVTLPFEIRTPAQDRKLAAVHGNQIHFVQALAPRDVVSLLIHGFGEAGDYDIRVDNRKTGVGVHVIGNRPMTKLALWSIRSVLSMEPFIDVSTSPGGRTNWTTTYTHVIAP
ncbi:MAG TPA: hypothetical protein VNA44_08650 [Burkholderiaceae bacterium]|nr:hypothetical protein [Burkholderiaceae bacterium]